jgi:hypothetical protein
MLESLTGIREKVLASFWSLWSSFLANKNEIDPFVLNNVLFIYLFYSKKRNFGQKDKYDTFFLKNSKGLNSMQLIKNNLGRRQYDWNWFETRSNPKQRRHKEKLTQKIKKQEYKK